MPPKIKITKEEIIDTALNITRGCCAQAINARSIANILQCSTQPIFSNFTSMEELRQAVTDKADQLFREYMKREVENGDYPAYKASGMAYIRFAKEEKELFKLLYMFDRAGAPAPESSDLFDSMESLVQSSTGIDRSRAKLFHLEMWAYVHGIATMFATGYLDLEWTLVSKMITDAYQGLRKQYGTE